MPHVIRHGRRFLVIALAGTLPLAGAASAFAAFPGDNGRIAYQGYVSLGTVNAGGGDRQPLITGSSGQYYAGPSWSADGQRLAFSSNKDGSDGEIYAASADGTTVLPLTNNADEDNAPTWSPDGSRIAFESERNGGVSKVWIMNSDGTGAFSAAASGSADGAPAWSPEGTRIAFVRGVDGANRDIWVMNSDGGGAVPVETTVADDTNPDWSPDGTRIVFQRAGAGLMTMAANGTDQKPLPVPTDAVRPAWSPDGTKIVYDVFPELYVVNADGTGSPAPLTMGGSAMLLSQAPNWQPIPRPVTPPPPPPPGGGGPTDADGDGVSTPTDCDDTNPAIRPGAVDVPRDNIDQDCSGRDARFGVIARTIAGLWATYAGPYTKFTALTVKPARKGDTIKLTCKGAGCRDKGKTVKVKKNKRKLSMLKHLKGSKLRKGAVVRLRVTRPGTIGRVNTWTIRAPSSPKLVRRCVQPGAKKLSRCP